MVMNCVHVLVLKEEGIASLRCSNSSGASTSNRRTSLTSRPHVVTEEYLRAEAPSPLKNIRLMTHASDDLEVLVVRQMSAPSDLRGSFWRLRNSRQPATRVSSNLLRRLEVQISDMSYETAAKNL
jgi:hypothetical protein